MHLILRDNPAADAVDRLLVEHGFARVAAALAGRMFRRRGPPAIPVAPDLRDLPAHLRRDIGLPALPPPGLVLSLRDRGLG